MTELETNQATGGNPAAMGLVAKTLLVAGVGAAITGWGDFKAGFQEAFWHQQNLAY